jgi:cytochrome o ubiquinol oxidase subunit 2
MKLFYRILVGAMIILAAIIFFKIIIGGSTIALFNTHGPTATAERNLIIETVLLMLIIVVPMFIFLFGFAWKYRASNTIAKYEPNKPHAAWKELILWAIPAVLVAGLATLTWKSAHALDPYKPIASSAQPLTIEVVALQWKWLFIYPQQNIATINVIEFPVNTPVHFVLTADGPISSFWIPQLGTQIYAMAAMQTQLNTIADTTGEFIGKDTEINGAGYAGMQFAANSVSESDFNNWVESVKTSSTYPALTADAYNALSQPTENNPPAYYSSVDGDLFDGIMMKYMMPTSSMMETSTSLQGMSNASQTMPANMQMML